MMPARTAAAVTATGAFATGCLLTQLITVRSWRRAATPEAALRAFRRSGPATGAVLFPTEVLATGLLATLATTAVRQQRPEAMWWALATASMAGTLGLLPLFFFSANLQLVAPDCPPTIVPERLASWSRWNRARTGLAVLATALAGRAASTANTQAA